MQSVFSFNNYKDYLKYRASAEFKKRGLITEMARAANCQRSYLSQIITREVQLTPDQAFGLTLFWNFDESETGYFLLLVDLERAASIQLKNRIKGELKTILNKQANLKERLKTPALDTLELQQVYYSSWLWMAVHIIVSIPEYQTEDKIANHLGIKKEKIIKFLKQLRTFKLVNYQDGKWYHSGGNIHLNRESPLNSINHNNWRQQAILKSQMQNQNNIHYTSVFSLTLKDYEELRQMIFKFINESRNVISKSKEEILACFTCDFFKI